MLPRGLSRGVSGLLNQLGLLGLDGRERGRDGPFDKVEDGKVLGVAAKGIQDGITNLEQPEDGERRGEHRAKGQDQAEGPGGLGLKVQPLDEGVEQQVERAHQRDQVGVDER